MGKAIIIQDTDFSANAIYTGAEYTYEENNFTWGKGGIDVPGQASGNTNPAMSMVGLPLPKASEKLVYVGANGYKISAILTSDVASPTYQAHNYNYEQFDSPLDSVVVPNGKYYEIEIYRISDENADTSDGYKSLLLRVTA